MKFIRMFFSLSVLKPWLKFSAVSLLILSGYGCMQSASGGGDSSSSSNASGNSLTMQVTKGIVSGANCILRQANATGSGGQLIAVAASNANGIVDFGHVQYAGMVYVSCAGGTYTDESSGEQRGLDTVLRSAVNLRSNTHLSVTPLTELSVRRAVEVLGGINESNINLASANVARQFGIDSVDLFAVTPTDINRFKLGDNQAAEYALVLAGISEMHRSEIEGDTLATLLINLNQDMSDDGSLDATTKNNFSTAMDGFAERGYSRINSNSTVVSRIKGNVSFQPGDTPSSIASPSGGSLVGPVDVVLSANPSSSTIYYTLDGSEPTISSTVYSSPIRLTSTTDLRFFSVFDGVHESVNHQRYDLDSLATTASPVGGVYSGTQNITLQANKSGAVIYYTLDGSVPNQNSPVYLGPIRISATTTLRYFARHEGIAETSKTQVYTISSAPVANDSTLRAKSSGGIFSGSFNASGSNLTYSIVQQPSVGSVAVVGENTGSYNYQASSADCNSVSLSSVCQTSFVYRATDTQTNLSNDATVTVLLNRPPVASAKLYLINPLQSMSGQVTATDVDGDAFTYSVTNAPQKGTLNFNAANGSFTYTPDVLNQDARVSFTYRATDADANASTEKLVTFVIDGMEFDTVSNEFSDGGYLAESLNNSSDGNQAKFTYSLQQQAQKGVVNLNANGSFTYNANSNNESGVDSFVYRVINEGQLVDVTVNVDIADVALHLAKKYHAPIGGDFRIYLDNIVKVSNLNNYSFEFKIDGVAAGTINTSDNYWSYPLANAASGIRELEVSVLQNGILLSREHALLEIYQISSTKTLDETLLVIGDSITESAFPGLLKQRIQESNISGSVEFVGTNGLNSGANHEGWGGATWNAFVNDWPSLPGRSPFFFVDSQKLDVARYFNERLGGKVPNYVTIMLGINDVLQYSKVNQVSDNYQTFSSNVESGIFSYAEEFITNLKQAAPNATILIATVIPPGSSNEGVNSGFHASFDPNGYKMNIHAFMELQFKQFYGREDENIYVMPVYQDLDRLNHYLPSDSIHPSSTGSFAYDGHRRISNSYYNELMYYLMK